MSEIPEIIELAKVVDPFLNGGKLISYTSRYLTKTGENYGSIMLAITAKIQRPSDNIEELPLVVKLPPITNDFFWNIFQPERTCRAENAVYKYVAPAIRQLQLEMKLDEQDLFDGFPMYYGSRISLDPNAVRVDKTALLVQENLQATGFKAGNREKMFDLPHAKFILKEMAKYHALPIALRLKKPQVFEEKVRPYFRHFNINAGLSEEEKIQVETELIQQVAIATNNCDRYMRRVRELYKALKNYRDCSDEIDDTMYTTIAHCDLWINNLMLKYDDNGLPCKVKFVDFQISQYDSLAHDVIFFLFSSVESAVLEHHFDELILLYYQSFLMCLESLKISTDDYSYVGFLKEVHKQAPIEMAAALFMLKIILADHSTLPDDYKDVDMSVMSKNLGKENITKRTSDIIRLAEKYNFFLS
uniref:CHK domain-containing protein n=1 Tax=Glossina brevipalpis TaxID=37001 RepID=A0A1A9WZX5_9MUSC